MDDVILIGNRRDIERFRDAGNPSFSPPLGHRIERVQAVRVRCRVMAMTADTFAALPDDLARELREGHWPPLEIISPPKGDRARQAAWPLVRRDPGCSPDAVA